MEVFENDIQKITQAVMEVLQSMEDSTGINAGQTYPLSDSFTGKEMGIDSPLRNIGPAKPPADIKEVGIGIGPAFGLYMGHTICDLPHLQVLKEIMAGIEEEGMIPRIIRVTRTSDVAFIANDVAKLVGSGIAVGIQSKGTAVIHQKDLYPLTNLELFPQAPVLTLELYRAIGKNTAKYAKGDQVVPVKVINDIFSRPKYQVKAALMHTKETEYVVKRGEYYDVEVSS